MTQKREPMKPRSPQSTLSPLCPSWRRLFACLALSLACSRGVAPGDGSVAPPPSEPVRQQLVASPSVAASPSAAASPSVAASPPEPATSPASVASKPVPKAKLSAPAEVQLTVSGTSGEVQATLSMRATADIPRCVGRFVVPAGVTVTAGDREKDWGPVASGEQKQLRLTLLVPAQGSFVLAGGMDLYLSSGVRLHQGDAVQLGQ